jgi:DNA-binding MarR family transcriptional regulator
MWTHYSKIVQLNRMGQVYLNSRLADTGLSSGLFYFLLELAQNEGSSISDLSKAVGVDNAYGSRAVSQLVTMGYVEKKTDPTDERTCCLTLTPDGKKAARKVNQVVRKWISIITHGVSIKDWETFMGVFDQLHENACAKLDPSGEKRLCISCED